MTQETQQQPQQQQRGSYENLLMIDPYSWQRPADPGVESQIAPFQVYTVREPVGSPGTELEFAL